MKKSYSEIIHSKPTFFDAFCLCLFAVVMTLQPFLFQNELNLSELNLYLPGINATLQGMVPYRDFFHLRGPLEIYIPSFLMMFFGVKVSVLTVYFYVGNVLTLIASILIAKEILKTRYIFSLMTLVLVARTFPRVMFACWGGMRYAFGLMAILAIVYFFKKRKDIWIVLAGVFTALAGLTSIEMGAGSFVAIIGAFLYSFWIGKNKQALKEIFLYLMASGMVVLPFMAYLFAVDAFFPYCESTFSVVTQMEKVIDLRVFASIPKSFNDVVVLMVNPLAKNFRHVTPAYLYVFLLAFIVSKHVKQKKKSFTCPAVIAVGVYGLFLFATAFRNIWGAQLEMALQPEKILLFFLLEEVYLVMRERKIVVGKRLKAPHMFKKNIWMERFQFYGILFLLIGLLMSSLGYSYVRYGKRFIAFKVARYQLAGKDVSELGPLNDRLSRGLNLKRGRHITVPLEQAHEIEEVVHFVQENTGANEKVLVYPDMGSYYFFFDRPFVSRFPIAIFSWFRDEWHDEFLEELQSELPSYAILPKKIDVIAFRDYFTNVKNKEKYDSVVNIINEHYALLKNTEKSMIYQKIEEKDQ
jgi:hypothetical protein